MFLLLMSSGDIAAIESQLTSVGRRAGRSYRHRFLAPDMRTLGSVLPDAHSLSEQAVRLLHDARLARSSRCISFTNSGDADGGGAFVAGFTPGAATAEAAMGDQAAHGECSGRDDRSLRIGGTEILSFRCRSFVWDMGEHARDPLIGLRHRFYESDRLSL